VAAQRLQLAVERLGDVDVVLGRGVRHQPCFGDRTQWAKCGVAQRAHALALHAYDLMISLDLEAVSVDGCITQAPCGGDKAGPSPADRRKGGLKRSVATEGYGAVGDVEGVLEPTGGRGKGSQQTPDSSSSVRCATVRPVEILRTQDVQVGRRGPTWTYTS